MGIWWRENIMNLEEMGEFGFIRRISRGCIVRAEGVIKGIGDDAAVFTLEEKEAALVTTDLLVEGIHFLRDSICGFDLGYKAIAANLSDIAAMGGNAREAFISLAIPPTVSLEYLDGIYDGMKGLAGEFSVNILGGDTTASKRDLVINIAVVGSAPRDEVLFRGGAREGDIIFVSGFLGESRAGLHIILDRDHDRSEAFESLLLAHMRPRPHLREGCFLAHHGGVTSAMDVSDGITSDLCHMTKASGLGALLDSSYIPITDALRKYCGLCGLDPVEFALQGGEDYVLLFTVDPQRADQLSVDFEKAFGAQIFPIGVMESREGIEVREEDGMRRALPPPGWNHFRQD
ncbi:thiamine-phosphate kinase [bacterium]|nr:thiamine-phosphate kinase [bacterium]